MSSCTQFKGNCVILKGKKCQWNLMASDILAQSLLEWSSFLLVASPGSQRVNSLILRDALMVLVSQTLIQSRGRRLCFLCTSTDILGHEVKMTGGEYLLSPRNCPRRVLHCDLLRPRPCIRVIVLRGDSVRAPDSFRIVLSCLFSVAANL